MKSTDLKYTIQWILINVPPWVTTTWIKIYHHRYESSLMLSSGTNVPPFWPSFSVACLYVLKTWTPDVWTLMWLAFFVTQLTVFEIHPYQYGNHYFIIFFIIETPYIAWIQQLAYPFSCWLALVFSVCYYECSWHKCTCNISFVLTYVYFFWIYKEEDLVNQSVVYL